MDIPSGLFSYYQEAVDALLSSDYTSKDVLLYYEKKAPYSANGLSDSDEVSETILLDTIRLRVHNKTKQWSQTGGVQFTDGRCQIYGLMSDADTIKRCTYLEIEDHKFKLATEPMRHGFGTKYFTAFIELLK